MLRTVSCQALKSFSVHGSLKQCLNVNGNRLLFRNSDKIIKCWKCGAQKPDNLFCGQCNSLQEPNKSSTYFDIIGVEKSFDLKHSELTTKFRRLQNLLHPDRFGSKDKEELSVSETYSALVNEAYSTLLNPLERGLYLLKLEGMSIEEGSVQLDPLFLAEIMELNEELEVTTDTDGILKIARDNQTMLESLARQIDKEFKEKNLQEAKNLLTKMKYYWSFEEKIKEMKQKLGIVV